MSGRVALLAPTVVLGAEDNYRTQQRLRRGGIYAARVAALEPYRRPDPAEDVWIVPRDPSSVTYQAGEIVCPRGCTRLDAGVTLAVVLAAPARYLTPQGIGSVAAGCAVALDVVRRDVPAGQAYLARSFPTHTPLGALGPLVDDPDAELSLWVNGQLRQHARVSDMVVSPAQLLASITHRVPLAAGDIVLTGTPPGIAFDSESGWLRPGDEVRAGISGLDDLTVTVTAEA